MVDMIASRILMIPLGKKLKVMSVAAFYNLIKIIEQVKCLLNEAIFNSGSYHLVS